jgi:glutathione S-transferase
MRAFHGYVEAMKGKPFVLGNEITIADMGIVCAVGGIDFTGLRPKWRKQYPLLSEYFDKLHEMKEFLDTKPIMFDMTERSCKGVLGSTQRHHGC